MGAKAGCASGIIGGDISASRAVFYRHATEGTGVITIDIISCVTRKAFAFSYIAYSLAIVDV